MTKINYIGNSPETLIALVNSPYFTVDSWIFENRKADEFKDFINSGSCGIPCYGVANKDELYNILVQKTNARICVMHSFGLIINEKISSLFRIFNIHSGSLLTNRGRNPVEWAILLGWESDEVSIHEIDTSIDGGILVDAEKIEICCNDTVSDIRKKYFNHFPDLFKALDEYLSGKRKGVAVGQGIYREKVTEKHFTIDPLHDDVKTIKNKIRSQMDYNGAILFVEGKKHYIRSFEDFKKYGY